MFGSFYAKTYVRPKIKQIRALLDLYGTVSCLINRVVQVLIRAKFLKNFSSSPDKIN